MNTLAFIQKVRWIRRRAKRLKVFYGIPRAMAVFDAHLDWISLQGHPLPTTSGDHHEKNR